MNETSDRDAAEVEQQIADAFKQELSACADLESFAVSALDPWQGRPIRKVAAEEPPAADEILCLLFARATKTYKAALLLARQGYGEQAAMLNRSLFEGMAVAHWVAANEEEAAKRFLRGWKFDQYLLARVLEGTGWLEEGAEAPGPDLSDAELGEMRKDFGAYGQNLWTGHANLRKLVDEIEADWGNKDERRLLRNFLRVVNRDNTSFFTRRHQDSQKPPAVWQTMAYMSLSAPHL